MLQQLQSNQMEESEPINSRSQMTGELQVEVRKKKEDKYGCQAQGQANQKLTLIQILKQRYSVCFTTMLALVLMLIVLQLCLVGLLKGQRNNDFQRNIQVLKEYQQWEERKEQIQSKLDHTATPAPATTTKKKQSLRTRKIDPSEFQLQNQKKAAPLNHQQQLQTETQSQLQAQTQSLDNVQQINPSLPIVEALPTTNTNIQNPPSTISLNIQYDFESSPSTISNWPTIQSSPSQEVQVSQKQQNAQIPTSQTANTPRQNGINYESYTGITVQQVSNAVLWMQFKSYPLTETNPLIDSQREYYEQRYGISKYQELPICVVVPSYNNAVQDRHISNINSILMQEYSNYRIIFIDDASTDSTATDVTTILSTQTKLSANQYTIIRNSEQKKAMHNLRTAAINYCQPQDIFIVIDGDDQLIGRQVFKMFNAVFHQSGAWFVYSNFLTTNNYVGFSRIIPPEIIANNQYRKHSFVTSHLRAFYTQLFRNIKQEDLQDAKGEYLKAANDVAICFPILQQAQERVTYIPELSYYYNSDTGLNNHFLRLNQQKWNEMKLRKKHPYARLSQLFA